MQIILQQSVKHLGLVGDVVDVASGYFRNYLSPRKLAFLANPKSLAQLEHQKRVVEAKKNKARSQAEEIKGRLEALTLELIHATGGGDKLFGSITHQDISLKLREKSFEVEKKYIQMEGPIKTLGEHTVHVKLHPDVVASLKVLVARKEEEKKPETRKPEDDAKPRRKKTTVPAKKEARSGEADQKNKEATAIVEEKEEKAATRGARKPASKKKAG